MRMAELSRRSGVSTATIKYYLREGLLPAGVATAANQADYGEAHLDRLALIRALREAASVPVATIGRVFAAMEAHQAGTAPEYLTIAVRELSEPLDVPDGEAEEYASAGAIVAALLERLGWDVDPDSPGRDDLVRAVVAIHRFMPSVLIDAGQLVPYADAVRTIAALEIPDDFDPADDPGAVLRFSVLGTVLFEPVILALRRLAHVDRIRSMRAAEPRRMRAANPASGT